MPIFFRSSVKQIMQITKENKCVRRVSRSGGRNANEWREPCSAQSDQVQVVVAVRF